MSQEFLSCYVGREALSIYASFYAVSTSVVVSAADVFLFRDIMNGGIVIGLFIFVSVLIWAVS